FRQMDALDDAARVGPVGLQQRALADDGDRLLEGAHFQLEVDAHGRVDRHVDAVAYDAPEAAQLAGDAVCAVLQVREDVVARFVADRRIRDVRVHLGDGDGDARQRQPRRIDDVAEQRALHCLRVDDARAGQDERSRRYAPDERAAQETVHVASSLQTTNKQRAITV